MSSKQVRLAIDLVCIWLYGNKRLGEKDGQNGITQYGLKEKQKPWSTPKSSRLHTKRKRTKFKSGRQRKPLYHGRFTRGPSSSHWFSRSHSEDWAWCVLLFLNTGCNSNPSGTPTCTLSSHKCPLRLATLFEIGQCLQMPTIFADLFTLEYALNVTLLDISWTRVCRPNRDTRASHGALLALYFRPKRGSTCNHTTVRQAFLVFAYCVFVFALFSFPDPCLVSQSPLHLRLIQGFVGAH